MNKNTRRGDQKHRAAIAPSISLIALSFAAAATAQDGKIDFQTISLPRNIGLQDGHYNRAIRSAQEWDAWVNKLTEVVEPLPTVDFDRFIVLVASAGYKPHGPVIVTFDSITDGGNAVRVHISVTSPAACPKDPEAGHYAVLALIPQTDKPIQFDVSSRDTNCPS